MADVTGVEGLIDPAEVEKFGEEAAGIMARLRAQCDEERKEKERYQRVFSNAMVDIAEAMEIMGVPEEEAHRPLVPVVKEFVRNVSPSAMDESEPLIDEEKEREAFAHCFRLRFPVAHFDLRNIDQQMCKIWMEAKKQAALQQRKAAKPVGSLTVLSDSMMSRFTLSELGKLMPAGEYPVYVNLPVLRGRMSADCWRALAEAREVAMRHTMEARIPECGEFGGIAQNLDFAMNELAVLMSENGDLSVPAGCVRVTKEMAEFAYELIQDVAADVQEGGASRVTWESAVVSAWESRPEKATGQSTGREEVQDA